MQDFVKDLSAVSQSHRASVGAKAANLGHLKQSGWLIPHGFCITTVAYQQFIDDNKLWDLLDLSRITDRTPEEIDHVCRFARRSILMATMPPEVARSVEHARQKLASNTLLAVRSSAPVEDVASASFAGIFDTLLNVSPETLLESVKICWASLWNAAAVTWLMKCQINISSYSMAVIVQQMVQPEFSGVMFTANPISGDRFQIVIKSCAGLGEAVVRGDEQCDTFIVREKDLAIIDKRIATRDARTCAVEVHTETRLGQQIDFQHSLSDNQVIEVATIGLQVQNAFENPQDIEWAIKDGNIYLLQSRPIVGLPPYFPLKTPVTPQGVTKWHLEFGDLFSDFGRSLELLKNPVYTAAISNASGCKFVNDRAVVNGYIYHHKKTMPPRFLPRWTFKCWQYLRWLAIANRADQNFRENIRPLFLVKTEQIRSATSAAQSLEDLIRQLEASVQCYLDLQAETVLVNTVANAYSNLLLRISQLIGGQNDLLTGARLLIGTENETVHRDRALADIVAFFHESKLSPLLDEVRTWSEFLELVKTKDTADEFLKKLAHFNSRYGYIWADGNVKDPGWQENHDLLMSILRSGVGLKNSQSGVEVNNFKSTFPASQSGSLLRRILLDRIAQSARRYFPYREDHNHYLASAVVLIRSVLYRCGELLVQLRLVRTANEIFYLTYAEVLALPEAIARGRADHYPTLIRERAQEADRQKRLTPVEVIDLTADHETHISSDYGTMRLVGTPGSPGMVSGPARVVTRVDLEKVRQGDILVCYNFRPDWSPLLRQIRGLVTNQGHYLTHGANLAREWGIPAVMGVREATRLIRDGAVVRVDGNNGIVHIQSGP